MDEFGGDASRENQPRENQPIATTAIRAGKVVANHEKDHREGHVRIVDGASFGASAQRHVGLPALLDGAAVQDFNAGIWVGIEKKCH